MQRFYWSYNQNDRNSFERCALSGPQKHITKESDGFHNHSTQLTMLMHRNQIPHLPEDYDCQIPFTGEVKGVNSLA